MDTVDLRSRVVALEQGQGALVPRVGALETWQRQKDIDSARHDERWRNMDEKIEVVGKKVDKISDSLSRIMWLILSGLILAGVAFVVQGGLAT